MSEPCVIRETAAGYVRTTLTEEAFQRREIELVGRIDQVSSMEIIRQLRFLADEDPKKPIKLLIHSGGGEVISGLAIYDTMQAVPCPVHTVCIGEAASMAAILLAAGSAGGRSILPNAYVMIHDPLITNFGGSALSMEAVTNRLMQTREDIAKILSKHTGRGVEEILAKTSRDSYFGAEDAVAFGLVDSVIETWGV